MMPLDLGIAASGASSAESGGPFYNDASINFAPDYRTGANLSNSPDTVSDATASAKSPGASSNAPAMGGAASTAASSPTILWIALAVAGAAALWLVLRK
jgi:hypothetical protein